MPNGNVLHPPDPTPLPVMAALAESDNRDDLINPDGTIKRLPSDDKDKPETEPGDDV